MADLTNVHVLHCCRKHGCRYGEPRCPVVWNNKASSPCCVDCAREEREQTERPRSASSYEAESTTRIVLRAPEYDRRRLGIIPGSRRARDGVYDEKDA